MTDNELKAMQEKLKGFKLKDELFGYFPKDTELERHFKDSRGDDLAPIIVYLAGDPLKDEEEISNRSDYEAAVRKAKELLEKMKD